MAKTCYIGVGSNMGDRQANIAQTADEIKKLEGVKFLRASSIYETEPVGGPPQGKFLNCVFEITTSLMPKDLLERLREVERSLGRARGVPNGPRTIDLDMLLFGDEVINDKDLIVPHPRMRQREFVLKPLRELLPEFYYEDNR